MEEKTMVRFVGLIVNKNRENKGKPCTPIASKYRLIDFPLSNMVNAGARNIGVILNNNSRDISDHLGSGKDWGLERNANGLYLLERDQMTLNNNNGSNDLRDLLKNIDFLLNIKEEYVLVSGCNFIANIDYQKIFKEMCSEECDLLLFYKKNDQELSGVNEILIEEGKKFKGIKYVRESAVPDLLFMESYFIKKNILISLLRTANRTGIFCMNELLEKIKGEIRISLYEYKDTTFYIDGSKRYFEANMAFLDVVIWTQIFNNGLRQIYTKNSDYPPTIYGPESEVVHSLLTSGDQIDGKVSQSIVFRNVKIERNAKIENCIIGENSIIEEGVYLKNIILEAGCRISKDTTLISSSENPMIIS